MKNILVTGGIGFIGSAIVKRLLKDGYSVRAIDIRAPENPLDERIEFLHGDITNRFRCEEAMEGIDTVFHTAAVARTMDTVNDPMKAQETNATGTLLLLKAAKDRGVKRFVHSSSSILAVPKTPYFVTKQCAESWVSIFALCYGLSTISLRYANVYGPGQRRDGEYPNVLAAMAKSKENKGKIFVTGTGKQSRSFVHVDDVVEANILAARSKEEGVFDIGTDTYTSILECAEMFECPISFIPDRPGDAFTIPIDTFPARKVLKFKAKIPFNKQSIKPYL